MMSPPIAASPDAFARTDIQSGYGGGGEGVLAETAALSAGAAWLPDSLENGRGTSSVVARSPVLRDVRERQEGRLALDDDAPDRVVASQAGGFGQRREGLLYRPHLTGQARTWHPPERAAPRAPTFEPERRAACRIRIQLTERLDPDVVRRESPLLLDAYDAPCRPPFAHRARRAAKLFRNATNR
jgi:hypothetical protein